MRLGSRVARLVRVGTLPETRGLIATVAHSGSLGDLRRRAVHDRGALVRDLGNPAKAKELVRSVARHPATRELAGAGLMLLPMRYLPLGWVATWGARRVLRRYVDPTGVEDTWPVQRVDRVAGKPEAR